jgi:hypothetical protein
MAPVLHEIRIGDHPEAWAAAGFALDADGSARVGDVRLRFVGRDAGKRILGWTLRHCPDPGGDVDGLPTEVVDTDDEPPGPAAHPNGVVAIDHVVVLTPDSDRTVGVLGRLGIEARRTRDVDAEQYGFAARQTFFRLGEPILELLGPIEPQGDGPAGFFGLAFTVADLDATQARLGPLLPKVKDAVQPGRRIGTLRHKDVDISVATAFMSPEPAG